MRGLICLSCNVALGLIEKKGKEGREPFLAYLASPPLAHLRKSYWWLKYTDRWYERLTRYYESIGREAVSRPTYA